MTITWLRKIDLTDCLLIVMLPILFSVSFSGPMSFTDKDALFLPLGNTEGNVLIQLGTITLFAVGIYNFFKLRLSLATVLYVALPLIPFLLWALISVGWSDYPGLTIRRSVRLIMEMTGIILIAALYARRPDHLFRIFFYVCFAILMVDLALVLLPSSFSTIGYVGLHNHKQLTGRFLLIAALFLTLAIALPQFRNMRRQAVFGLLVCLALLFITRSKTIWVALPASLIAASAAPSLFNKRLQGPAIAFICFASAMLIFITLITGFDIEGLLDAVFGDPTLTGRDQIWKFVFVKYDGNEIAGVGYGALWQTGPEIVQELLRNYKIIAVNQAHNGYIEILVQTGIVGCILLTFTLLTMLFFLTRDARLTTDRDRYLIFISFFMFFAMLIINLTDSTIFLPQMSTWAETVFFYALVRFRHLARDATRTFSSPASANHHRVAPAG